jgi:WD40 repeat protein
MRELKTKLSSIEKLLFSPDGNGLLVSYETLNVGWRDWKTGKLSPEIITDFRYSAAAWAPDNSGVFLSVSRGVRFLDLETNQVATCGIPYLCSGWFHTATTGTSYAIVTHGNDKLTRFDYLPDKKKFLKQWSIERGKLYSHYCFGNICDQHGTITTIEVGSKRGNEVFWITTRSTTDGSEIHRLPFHEEAIQKWTFIAWHPSFRANGEQAALAYGDHVAVLNFRESNPKRLESRMFDGLECHKTLYHPDGKSIFLSSMSNSVIEQFDLETRERIAVFEGNTKIKLRYISALAITPDGQYLAAAHKGKVVIWEMSEGRKP